MQYQSGAVSPVGSISDGWNLIKNDYWLFFGMTTVMVFILIIVATILNLINNGITFALMSVLGIATTNATDLTKVSASVAPQLISMVISIFTSIILTTLSGCLYCGIYAGLSRKANTGTADFGDLFSGFQKFTPCLIVAVVLSIIQFIIGVVMLFVGVAFGVSALGAGMMMGKDGQPDFAMLSGLLGVISILFVLYLVISLILGALTTFIYPLIGERNLSGMEAFSLSIKSGFANIGGLILMLILLGLIAVGGAFVCLIGVLFVFPVLISSVFMAFQNVFGKLDGNQFNYAPPPPPTFGNQPGY